MASAAHDLQSDPSSPQHVANWAYELVPWEQAPWAEIEASDDCTHSKSRAWLEFLQTSQQAEPVVARVLGDENTHGYFIGAVVSKLGLRILGSPFPGWTTSHMGIVALNDGVDRAAWYKSVLPDMTRELGCVYAQVLDVELDCDAASAVGLKGEAYANQFIDLTRDEDDIFAGLTSACRRAVRKGRKNNLRVVETEDPQKFATEYYVQLLDVFKKQSLVPTYDEARVHALINALYPTGNLLLLETRDPDDRCIATGLFPGSRRMMEFWGGASYRESQNLRPNEMLFFEAICIWKSRGCVEFDLGGFSEYKHKFGPVARSNPFIQHARWPVLHTAKSLAQKSCEWRQRVSGARANKS